MDTPRMLTVTLPDGRQCPLEYDRPVCDLLTPEVLSTLPFEPLVARVDNKVVDLSYRLRHDSEVFFLGLDTPEGRRAYRRTLGLVLVAAVNRTSAGWHVTIEHSLGICIFCKIKTMPFVSKEVVALIREHMEAIIRADLPIERIGVSAKEAEDIFEREGAQSKKHLVHRYPSRQIMLYRCAGMHDLFPGPHVPRTGCLRLFGLETYPPGMVLRLPDPAHPDQLGQPGHRPKLFRIFHEYEHWGEILQMESIARLNERLALGNGVDIVHVAEALHEKKIAQIADQIHATRPQPRIVLIAGPSSSGKTTFSRRLAVQLRVLGLKTHTLSIDDYFLNRADTPRGANGDFDFEALQAIDIPLFNEQLNDLIDGRAVVVPRFDFRNGVRCEGSRLRLSAMDILLVEGIHGLNDDLTRGVWPHMKWKIYVSALTQLNVDDHNAIATSDSRLIRRIVRDSRTRGYGAEETILRWPAVRHGEERNIFPFQEQADVMFNSALVYEGNVLAGPASELLRQVSRRSAAYPEADRLLDLLAMFVPMRIDYVPHHSILQEFLGGTR